MSAFLGLLQRELVAGIATCLPDDRWILSACETCRVARARLDAERISVIDAWLVWSDRVREEAHAEDIAVLNDFEWDDWLS